MLLGAVSVPDADRYNRRVAPADPEPLDPVPAGEDPGVLRLHLIGTAAVGAGQALWWFLPFLARQRFDANDLQTLAFTAAVPVAQFLTIFWNHIYARVPIRVYFALVAGMTVIPIATMAVATNVWMVMVCFAIAAFGGVGGGAGLSPLNADMLRACYAVQRRGRAFGWVSAAGMMAVMITGQGIGWWSDADRDAFRVFLPILAGLNLFGLFMYERVSRRPVFRQRSLLKVEATRAWWEPLRDMGAILRRDRRFAAYEVAFMSYGMGFMICTALVPILGTDRLGLSNTEYTRMTVVVFQFTVMLLFVPAGRVADRVGPARLASGSFFWLTLYPLSLIACSGATSLGASTLLFAMGMAGVHLTWTLGPVAMAPDPSRAPHYLAIHGTLVGVRGIVAQSLGVALYAITGGFAIPFAVAAAGFCFGGWHMRRLARESAR